MLENFEKHLYSTIFPEHLPKTVYHYTTQGGILGIIQQGEIWATQVAFLNDKNEVYLTFRLLANELNRRRTATSDPYMRALLAELQEILKKVDRTHICISSFCEEGDLLSQWRGYGNQGKGYSLGFDLNKLFSAAKKQDFVIWPCVYDNSTHNELVSYLVDCWLQKYGKGRAEYGNMVDDITSSVCRLAPILKDRNFKEEKEWRLVNAAVDVAPSDFSFREGAFAIIPYLAFKLGFRESENQCLEKIVLGPTPHKKLALNSTRMFLQANGLKNTEVVLSSIPFRNWK